MKRLLIILLISLIALAACGHEGAPVPTYSISGTITTASGVPVSDLDVRLNPTSANSQDALTDASGNYIFTQLLSGSTNTVEPIKGLTSYTFSPTSITVTIDGANVQHVDFIAN